MGRSLHTYRGAVRLSLPLLLALFLLAPEMSAQRSGIQRRTVFTSSSTPAAKTSARTMSLRSNERTVVLDVNLAAVRSVNGPDLYIGAVPIAPGVTVDLDLHEYTVLAPDARISATDDNGEFPVTPTVKMYRGKISGNDQSDVYLAFSNTGVLGYVVRNEKTYEISTDLNTPVVNDRMSAMAYPVDEIQGNVVRCGLNDRNLNYFENHDTHDNEVVESPKGGARTMEGDVPDSINYSVKGGYDGDLEYFQLFGNETAALDYMISVAGQVGAVFERDLQTQIVISSSHVWMTAVEHPYKEATVMDLALGEATGHWQKDKDNIFTRGFMHVMSGKPWVNPIGIAWLNVMCDNGTSYSAITYKDPARDLRVVAHEIGHNFGMKHTHDCSWGGPESGAIDRCAPAEGGNCFTGTEQVVGTIMSYCSQSDMKFHDIQRTWMIAEINKNKCFEQARALTVYPRRVIFPTAELNIPDDTIMVSLLSNRSKEEVIITKYDLTGNVDAFEFEDGALDVPDTIKPGESKDVKVIFTAKVEGKPQFMKMFISHNGLNFISQGPIQVAFEGYAKKDRPFLEHQTGGSGSIDFGEQPILRPVRDTLERLFFNNGTAPLHATETMIIGKDQFDFKLLTGSAPFSLDDGAGRDGVIEFTPSSIGYKEALLVTTSNSSRGEIDTLKLTGIGTAGGVGEGVIDLQIRSGAIDFGETETQKSYDTTLYNFYYNGGTIPLLVSFFVHPDSGVSYQDFTSNNQGNLEIAPGTGGDLELSIFSNRSGEKRGYLIVSAFPSDDPLSDPVSYSTIPLLANASGISAVPGEPGSSEGITVSPNPAAGDIDVSIAPLKGEDGISYRLEIVDVVGKSVYSADGRFEADRSIERVKTEGWANGTYYVRITTEKGTRTSAVTVKR